MNLGGVLWPVDEQLQVDRQGGLLALIGAAKSLYWKSPIDFA